MIFIEINIIEHHRWSQHWKISENDTLHANIAAKRQFGPFWTNFRAKNRAFWAIGQKQKLVHGSPRGVPKWDLSDIAIKIAIDHHWGDITQYKSLFHYGEPPFLAYLGCTLPEGGIKIWSQGWFHMPPNPDQVPESILPTFGIIKAKKISNNPPRSDPYHAL